MNKVTQIAAVQYDSTLYTIRKDHVAGAPNSFGSLQPNLYWSMDTGYSTGGRGWKEGDDPIGTHWGFAQVVHAGSGVLYAVQTDGTLRWYRHRGRSKGTANWAKGSSTVIGGGFYLPSSDRGPVNYLGIFCDCGFGNASFVTRAGVTLYAVRSDGTLDWFRDDGALEGTGAWANDGRPKSVGQGWVDGYRRVFSGGHGIIYLIGDDGVLWWYNHRGYADGTDVWDERQEVGNGWADFRNVFSIGGGHIYALEEGGKLWRYHHSGHATGAKSWSERVLVRPNWYDRLPVANSVNLDPGRS